MAFWATFAWFLAALTGSFASAAEARPNVIVILADDLGYGDLSGYGATDIRTPNIDRLKSEGTQFTNFYVAQAVCTASRAALLTGCYPNRLHMAGALNHTSATGIASSEVLLSELCRSAGYATAIYGKWHLGHHTAFLPTRHGFDEFVGIPYSNDNGPLHPVAKGIPPLPLYENEEIVALDPDQSQFTNMFTERAVRFIEKNKDRPFFLYLPHVMPHVPIFASEKFRGTSSRGLYGDVVQELDASVGAILAALRQQGIDEKTIVVFASDNGPFLSYGEHAGSAAPFREGKLTIFEGGVRVPCLARWPGRVPADRKSDELITTMDLFVTLADLVGAPLPKRKLDGVNLKPLLLGEANAKGRESFAYYAGDELQAVRIGDWKLHFPHDYLTVAAEPGRAGKPSNFGKMHPASFELSGIRGIASRHGYRVEKIERSLFNLKSDPGETTNVIKENPDVVEQLDSFAEAVRADLGDELTKRPGSNLRASGDIRPPLPKGVRRLANLEYAETPSGKQLIDLYLPEGAPAGPLPTVLWIHGGGWKGGSKENCPLVWMVAEGYAVASLDYRLTQYAKWPAQIDDCRSALRWLRKNSSTYSLDPDRIGIGGGSAGGHLVAMLGTQQPPVDEPISSRVRAVYDQYGPSDLLSMPANIVAGKTREELAKSNSARLLGDIVADIPEIAKLASPIHHVSMGDAPFLILHGTKDEKAPVEQSQRLHDKLVAAGVPSTLHLLEGAGHGGKAFDTPEVRRWVLAFFDQHLKQPAGEK